MRYHKTLREATKYINNQYRGPAAKAAGRNIGREGKKVVAAGAAKAIEMDMLAKEPVTVESIHEIIDSLVDDWLDDED